MDLWLYCNLLHVQNQCTMSLYIILDIVILKLIPVLIYLYSTGKSLWQLFIEQFDDLLVKILLAAATISFVSVHCDSITLYHTSVLPGHISKLGYFIYICINIWYYFISLTYSHSYMHIYTCVKITCSYKCVNEI